MSHNFEFGIIREFHKLNIQNLLLLQAELACLDSDLAELANRDFAHTDRKMYHENWCSLALSNNTDDNREQYEKVLAIRKETRRVQ